MNDNYKKMRARIRATDGTKSAFATLKRLEASIDRLYDSGVFSLLEYKRLDLMVFDRQVKIDNFE